MTKKQLEKLEAALLKVTSEIADKNTQSASELKALSRLTLVLLEIDKLADEF